MITTIEADRYFHITGLTTTEIEDEISTAVSLAQIHAKSDGWEGVLVTRHEPGVYTVNLSSEIPYGITMERNLDSRTKHFH
ncbi:hypothetical protein J2Y66_000962 [Paenarthrobacter nitroguajacolicus]|uniref:hypothetical protein n=1 Tax=Paenarthrobacter nitroguajacolicus TaxID=211146 RepID=UPI002855EA3F|nr:hypothetical protein [Paenarthrobacter nitroguajacolicus]MDR6986492.1 hypothetical protein [Paenarthrobacter nitroguajacolicus]